MRSRNLICLIFFCSNKVQGCFNNWRLKSALYWKQIVGTLMSPHLVVPVIVVEVDGVERRVDLLEGLPVPQLLLEMLPGVGPQVPVGARQDADTGGLCTEKISNDMCFMIRSKILRMALTPTRKRCQKIPPACRQICRSKLVNSPPPQDQEALSWGQWKGSRNEIKN